MTLTASMKLQGYSAIREEVVKRCATFPGPYWQAKDRARECPLEFVGALGEAGYLAVLIAVFLALIWRQSSLLKVREFPVLNLGNLPRKRAEFWGISVLSISADET